MVGLCIIRTIRNRGKLHLASHTEETPILRGVRVYSCPSLSADRYRRMGIVSAPEYTPSGIRDRAGWMERGLQEAMAPNSP